MTLVSVRYRIEPGSPLPLGTSLRGKGVNFSLFSAGATSVTLCFFRPGEEVPFWEVLLDPNQHRTGDLWHIWLESLPHELHYSYRVDGPYDPLQGDLFDPRNALLDPYAKSVVSSLNWGKASDFRRAVVFPTTHFDWEEDQHPRIPLREIVVYEMHVRGFTKDPKSEVAHPGTFSGIIEKIPYLKRLGVNAIELLPIFEFNENEHPHFPELHNYWGYSTINYFSIMKRYSSGQEGAIIEFKKLVKALHQEGIEIYLDVVYNHTAEGNEEGPSLSFKGFGNSSYYLLAPGGTYYNFSGCGNSVNANEPVVTDMILDSLRYFVSEMHVDGFRFDLASGLTRSHDGLPLANPPLIERIAKDPLLAQTKLIAEAWDAGGLYQVGAFPHHGHFAEWNGRFRDDVRSFLKGSDGKSGAFATRIAGSEDLYHAYGSPEKSINFITAHDGFTLLDLVSYNEKHNEKNFEENRDGDDHNESWNMGIEGPTEDPKIFALRQQQMRNFLLALFVSQGTPMLHMGDEVAHTKGGNNNSWCHDSPLNWFPWIGVSKRQGLLRFTQKLIEFRKECPLIGQDSFLTPKDIIWHGWMPFEPHWNHTCRFCAFQLLGKKSSLYVAFNANFEEAKIKLPPTEHKWRMRVNTAKRSPLDFVEEAKCKPLTRKTLTLPPYSSILLDQSF